MTNLEEYRYGVSKLLEVLLVRELVSRISAAKSPAPPVIINLVSPGLCTSTTLDRGAPRSFQIISFIVGLLLGRSTEKGARTFVLAASAGPKSHGEFMGDGHNQDVENWIYGDVGKRAQKKVFEQTMRVLETRKPGVGQALGL